MSTSNGAAAVDLSAHLDELYPLLFDPMDQAFPEFAFVRRGRAWTATCWPAEFPCVVNDTRPDGLMVYDNRPWRVKVHGHEGVRLLDLVNSGRRPKGAEFLAAVRKLSQG